MTWEHSEKFGLTKSEGRIMAELAKGEPVSGSELLLVALGKRFASPQCIPTHIWRIRAKLDGSGLAIDNDSATGVAALYRISGSL